MLAASLFIFLAGESSAAAGESQQTAQPAPRPDLVRQPYSAADVDFMTGMIPHHAQAVLIAHDDPRLARSAVKDDQ